MIWRTARGLCLLWPICLAIICIMGTPTRASATQSSLMTNSKHFRWPRSTPLGESLGAGPRLFFGLTDVTCGFVFGGRGCPARVVLTLGGAGASQASAGGTTEIIVM